MFELSTRWIILTMVGKLLAILKKPYRTKYIATSITAFPNRLNSAKKLLNAKTVAVTTKQLTTTLLISNIKIRVLAC